MPLTRHLHSPSPKAARATIRSACAALGPVYESHIPGVLDHANPSVPRFLVEELAHPHLFRSPGRSTLIHRALCEAGDGRWTLLLDRLVAAELDDQDLINTTHRLRRAVRLARRTENQEALDGLADFWHPALRRAIMRWLPTERLSPPLLAWALEEPGAAHHLTQRDLSPEQWAALRAACLDRVTEHLPDARSTQFATERDRRRRFAGVTTAWRAMNRRGVPTPEVLRHRLMSGPSEQATLGNSAQAERDVVRTLLFLRTRESTGIEIGAVVNRWSPPNLLRHEALARALASHPNTPSDMWALIARGRVSKVVLTRLARRRDVAAGLDGGSARMALRMARPRSVLEALVVASPPTEVPIVFDRLLRRYPEAALQMVASGRAPQGYTMSRERVADLLQSDSTRIRGLMVQALSLTTTT